MEKIQDKKGFEETDKQSQKIPKTALIIETSICKSKDGKWLMYKTIITDIKPVAYFEKVLKGEQINESGLHK